MWQTQYPHRCEAVWGPSSGPGSGYLSADPSFHLRIIQWLSSSWSRWSRVSSGTSIGYLPADQGQVWLNRVIYQRDARCNIRGPNKEVFFYQPTRDPTHREESLREWTGVAEFDIHLVRDNLAWVGDANSCPPPRNYSMGQGENRQFSSWGLYRNSHYRIPTNTGTTTSPARNYIMMQPERTDQWLTVSKPGFYGNVHIKINT